MHSYIRIVVRAKAVHSGDDMVLFGDFGDELFLRKTAHLTKYQQWSYSFTVTMNIGYNCLIGPLKI